MRRPKLFGTALAVVSAVALAAFAAAPAVAQPTGTIEGAVTTSGGRPLAGAQVFLAGADIAAVAAAGRIRAVTDEAGRYTLSNVPAGASEVRSARIGYSQQIAQVTVISGQTTEVNFELNRSVIALDEIVVSGAGGQVQKKQLGNTISTVDASAIEMAPVTDFGTAIAGREPSVVGLPSGGLAGQGSRIRIRGTNSLSMSNEPVIYVDGVRVDNRGGFAGLDSPTPAGQPSRLDDINPESIERIEILKGAAAATLYGSEASSGVIQIFTKRGSSGAPRFSFRIDQGISNFVGDRVKPLAGFARDQAQADKLNALYGGEFHDGNRQIVPFEVFESDIIRDLWETGRDQVYSANVTGGGEDVQYYVAGRATFTDGPWGDGGVFEERLGPNKDFNRRYQGNFAVTLFPQSRLQFRANGMFADVQHDTPQNGNNIYGPVGMAWWAKPEVANCDDSSVDTSQRLGEGSPFFCTGAGNPHGAATFGTIREFSQTESGESTEHFQGGLTMSYEATSAINVEAVLGYDVVNSRAFEISPFRYDVDGFTGRRTDGFRDIGARTHREVTIDAKVRWNERFLDDKISSGLTVGGQGFIAKDVISGGQGITFPGPGLEVAEAAADQRLFESRLEKVNAGFFAQEQIGYNDVVFVTVGGRFDRNSAFGEEEDAAFYPKAGISVIPSDMSGWNSSLVSTLRVRAAVGQSGLQPGAFDRLTTFQPGPTVEGAGLRPDNLGNPALKPEKTTEWEFGAEIGLFDNVASLDFTYWNRSTKDALVNRTFPVSGGFRNSQLDNVGQLDANGFEIKGDWLVWDRENLSISLFANGAFIKETITSLGAAPPFKVAGTYPRPRNFVMEGFAPGSFFGGKIVDFTPGSTVPFDQDGDGLADTEASFRTYLGSQDAILLRNDINPLLRDDDNDGDLLDHFLGKPTPDWQGSVGTQVTLWNNLQVNTLFEYAGGKYVVQNLTDQFRRANPAIGRNVRATAELESTLMNPETRTDVDARFDAAMQWATEIASLAPFSGLNSTSKADWIRWRELSITYTVPTSFTERLGLTNLAINFTGRNLKLWSTYDGTDPEVNAFGACGGGGEATTRCSFSMSLDSMGLPLARRYALSLRFGF
jgi:TonB-linked SusC/RagA family outer membrane protein